MPLERDAHEALLNELNNPELEHSRRTELLQQLRVDYGSVLSDFTDNTSKIKKLSEENADLVVANSKLFRQGGFTKDEDHKEDEKKEFSETVTISQLEKE